MSTGRDYQKKKKKREKINFISIKTLVNSKTYSTSPEGANERLKESKSISSSD